MLKTLFKTALILLITNGIQLTYSQNPFKTLNKAEKLFKNGKHQRTLTKIEKAENSKYCTCGSCLLNLLN